MRASIKSSPIRRAGSRKVARDGSRTDLLIGYARAASDDQNLEFQLSALKGAGCGRLFMDQCIGAGADRPGLIDALSYLRPGDSLTVWKLDRLGCGAKGLVDLMKQIATRGAHFQSLTEGINTRSAGGAVFFQVMGSLAQMEHELVIERTRAGLVAARKLGRVGGRKRSMTDGKVRAARKLLGNGRPPREVAHNLGVSVPTLYRWLPASERV